MQVETKPLMCAVRGPGEKPSGQHSNGVAPDAPNLLIREILSPLDFSEHSNAALKYAIRFAEQVGARITLLHVVKPALGMPEGGVWCLDVESVNQIVQAAEQVVARICNREKLRPPALGPTIVRIGVPSEVIKETAADQSSDLIILATHGRTGLAHALLGSDAESVIRQAPCPVLVVRTTAGEDHIS